MDAAPPKLPPLRLAALTLAEGAAHWFYSASCRACGRSQIVIDLEELLRRRPDLGATLIEDIRPMLRCNGCGAKSTIVCIMEAKGTWLPAQFEAVRQRKAEGTV